MTGEGGRSKKVSVPLLWMGILACALALFRVYSVYQDIRNEPLTSWTRTQTGDCAVVLTGGPGRVREGFDLLANRLVKKLVIAGVYANSQLRDIMPMWPLYGSLSEGDVVLERHSETTYGNAVQSLPIVEAFKCQRVLLVTSRLHMARAYKTFRALYPPHIEIAKQAIISGRLRPSFDEVGLEIFKSLFYSLWVY